MKTRLLAFALTALATTACLPMQAQHNRGAAIMHAVLNDFLKENKKKIITSDISTEKYAPYLYRDYTLQLKASPTGDMPSSLEQLTATMVRNNTYTKYSFHSDEESDVAGITLPIDGKHYQVLALRLKEGDHAMTYSFPDGNDYWIYLIAWNKQASASLYDCRIIEVYGDSPHYTHSGEIGREVPKLEDFPRFPLPHTNQKQVAVDIGRRLLEQKQAATQEKKLYIDGKYPISRENAGRLLSAIHPADGSSVGVHVLVNKVERLYELCKMASPEELAAITATLKREVEDFKQTIPDMECQHLRDIITDMNVLICASTEGRSEAMPPLHEATRLLMAKRAKADAMRYLSTTALQYLAANGWIVTKNENVATHVVMKSQHYTGDPNIPYLDGFDSNCKLDLHVEQTIDTLQPGRYRLAAIVRAEQGEHSGAFVFAETGRGYKRNLYTQEIPSTHNTGGELWEAAAIRVAKAEQEGRPVNDLDVRIATANHGLGFGWCQVIIDDIPVEKDEHALTFGVTTLPEYTGTHFSCHWFSACDFILERIGDL